MYQTLFFIFMLKLVIFRKKKKDRSVVTNTNTRMLN